MGSLFDFHRDTRGRDIQTPIRGGDALAWSDSSSRRPAQYLPGEALRRVNNWFLHKIGGTDVISRRWRSIGRIDESLWSRFPSLAPGQAIVSITPQACPLPVSVDPTPCRLLTVE